MRSCGKIRGSGPGPLQLNEPALNRLRYDGSDLTRLSSQKPAVYPSESDSQVRLMDTSSKLGDVEDSS